MITEDKIIEFFCKADEFCKFFNKMKEKYSISPSSPSKRCCHRDSRMNAAEIIVIMITFHSSNNRCMKHLYLDCICKRYSNLFPNTVLYNRFVEIIQKDEDDITLRVCCN